MKNFKLIALLFAIAAIPVSAQTIGAQSVKIVVPSLSTCTAITLSNSAPTEITGNAALVSGGPNALVYDVTVWNNDATNDVYCSGDSAVAASGTAHLGARIIHVAATVQPNFLHWIINPFQKWYCIGSGGTPIIMTCKQS